MTLHHALGAGEDVPAVADGGGSGPGAPAAPSRRRRWWWTAIVSAVVLAGAAGFVFTQGPRQPTGGGTQAPSAVTGTRSPAPVSTAGLSPIGPYLNAVDVAAHDGLRVWLEVDLVKRWQAGPAQFQVGVERLAELARRPGVVGFKVADELGYNDGMTTPDKILSFLSDTATALHRVAPGKKILIDFVIPELGCLPGMVPQRLWATVEASRLRGLYPQLALDQVDRYVRSGTVDVVDVSSGLLDDRTYAGWGSDRNEAQTLAWQEIRRRGWSSSVTVQARRALADAGGYAGTPTQATGDLRTFIDIPGRLGAQGVDVWTWAQHYKGTTYALLDAQLTANPLWTGMQQRHRTGVRLLTNFTPSLTLSSVDTDLARLATVFTDVFIATGTG
jgi:hypothetical protein